MKADFFEKTNNSKILLAKSIKEKSKKVDNNNIGNFKMEHNKYNKDKEHKRILFIIYANKFEID